MMAFKGHKPCGYELLVNHINKNKLDNRLENLEVVTNRDNIEHSYGKFSSKYYGVSRTKYNRWKAEPWDKKIKKKVFLGYFNTEEEAHQAVEQCLKNNI